MTDNKTFELQHQVRQNALKIQEEFTSIKNFEQEMKRKEQEMLKNNAQNQQDNQVSLNNLIYLYGKHGNLTFFKKIPIRSNINAFQKFHDDESIKKMKTMSLEEENKSNAKQKNLDEIKVKANAFKEKGNNFVKTKNYESASM